jgi:hypothetical protein
MPSDPVAPSAGQVMEGRPPINLSSDGQLDTASVVSQVLHSPVINNLLTGVSEQTGVGSPNVLRNMLPTAYSESPNNEHCQSDCSAG